MEKSSSNKFSVGDRVQMVDEAIPNFPHLRAHQGTVTGECWDPGMCRVHVDHYKNPDSWSEDLWEKISDADSST